MFGIFAISMATLLLEIAFSRLFSAIFFYHLSFLIISTALFGFGVSGVLLSLFPSLLEPAWKRCAIASLLFSITVPLTLKITLALPFDINRELTSLTDASSLVLRYLFLALPFLFSGMVIGIMLTSFKGQISRLYFWDLIGAALGCLFPVILVPVMGANGTIMAAAVISCLSAFYFSYRHRSRLLQIVSLLLLVISAVMAARAETLFALPLDEIMATKHPRFYRQSQGRIEFSGWSPISRIDVLEMPGRKVIFIDCGSNVSFLTPFDGNLQNLRPRNHWRALPYTLTTNPNVLIIGPSGGEDVLTALSYRARRITGVELDPLINKLVTTRYKEYIGGIYNFPNVKLVTDEGRSFIRQSRERYDVIQQVHNISPVAFASGAINLSESYLLTEQSIGEYLDHLTDGGFLTIHRWGVIRIASIAITVLEKRGVDHPEEHLAVLETARGRGVTNTFILKKTKITAEEREKIRSFAKDNGYEPSFVPGMNDPANAYVRMFRSKDSREAFFAETGLNLHPPTDDRPFFDHFLRLGQIHVDPEKLGRDLAKTIPFLSSGDLVLFGVLAESIVFGLLLLVLPLIIFSSRGMMSPRFGYFIVYFFCLGIGFILVEITLIQKFILFLGNPTYSLSVILFSILASAGAGSHFSAKLAARFGVKDAVLVACICIIISLPLLYFSLTFLTRAILGVSLWLKVILSVLLISPVGFFLGMPFPLGLSVLESKNGQLVPWAWGMNGYATVLGSALCVLIAIGAGFKVVIAIGTATYVIALISMRRFAR